MAEIPAPPETWADLPFFTTHWPALRTRLATAPAWQPADPFRALRLTSRAATRVVILGQDPYPTPGRATGLAFSFPKGERPRHSLQNILTELASDIGQTKADGDLTTWADQGVLLLNTALTVPLNQANGHKGWGWEPLITQILTALAADGSKAFLLWGAPAQALCARLPRDSHLFLHSPHPSPLSAHRGFFGSRPFSTTNRWLIAQGQPPIDWAA
jgi:uracil-DNA glycosylase